MTTLSPKQVLSLKESNARINIWEGAVRSGKTYISLWRFLKELTYGPQGEYCIVARTYDSFKRNLLPLLSSMIGTDARYYAGRREMNIWGKTIHIIGADDESAEAKLRGPTFQGAYVDEATIIPESVFKQLIARCLMGEAKIFCTTNPDTPFHWLKRDYLTNNPDVKSWQFTLDDNPRLRDDAKEYLRRQYKGLWYQRFIEGKWVQAEGAIYDAFNDNMVLDFPLSEATEYIVGIDYGTVNPCAFVVIGINRDKYPNIWVEDEYYYDSHVHQRQKTDLEFAEDLSKFIRYKNVTAIYIDPSAASFRLELQRMGIQNLFEAKNEVNDGIRLVSTYLDKGTLKVVRKCQNLIKEFLAYSWDPKCQKLGADKPLKQNDHALDALRYAMYTHFFGSEGKSMRPEDIDIMRRDLFGGDQPNLPRFFRTDEASPFSPYS